MATKRKAPSVDRFLEAVVFSASGSGDPATWLGNGPSALDAALDAAPRALLVEIARGWAAPKVQDGLRRVAGEALADRAIAASEAEERRLQRIAEDPVFARAEEARTLAAARANELAWDAQHGAGAWARIQVLVAERRAAQDAEMRNTKARWAQEDAEREARSRASWQAMNNAIEQFRKEVIEEWSAALLAERFQLADGRFVSWGEATAAEHDERHASMAGRAADCMATAARHLQAAELIRAKGTATLAQAVDNAPVRVRA